MWYFEGGTLKDRELAKDRTRSHTMQEDARHKAGEGHLFPRKRESELKMITRAWLTDYGHPSMEIENFWVLRKHRGTILKPKALAAKTI